MYWQSTDKKMVARIHELLKDISRNHYVGIGKPEPLKHALSGFWSRRIDVDNRLVYKVNGNDILIAQMRYLYSG